MDDQLIQRAREYLTDKYLDLADVPKFIERLVQLHDANVRLQERLYELENAREFDLSDIAHPFGEQNPASKGY